MMPVSRPLAIGRHEVFFVISGVVVRKRAVRSLLPVRVRWGRDGSLGGRVNPACAGSGVPLPQNKQ